MGIVFYKVLINIPFVDFKHFQGIDNKTKETILLRFYVCKAIYILKCNDFQSYKKLKKDEVNQIMFFVWFCLIFICLCKFLYVALLALFCVCFTST